MRAMFHPPKQDYNPDYDPFRSICCMRALLKCSGQHSAMDITLYGVVETTSMRL